MWTATITTRRALGVSTDQQVDGAAHPVLAILVIDDCPVLQEALCQLFDHVHKGQALLPHGGVTLKHALHAAGGRGGGEADVR